MKALCLRQQNENGFALITAIMMLFAATIMGLMVMNSSEIEILLSGAQQRYENNFNVAEAGWVHGAYWLDGMASAPDRINVSISASAGNDNYDIVRNFGNGDDGVITGSAEDGNLSNTPYWFQVKYLKNEKTAGSNNKYRNYTYLITSNADNSKTIEVIAVKPFKTGY